MQVRTNDELKNTYTTREVAAMTGLTARQLQWWDARRVFASHIASKKTARGGYTERRYTPVDLLELRGARRAPAPGRVGRPAPASARHAPRAVRRAAVRDNRRRRAADPAHRRPGGLRPHRERRPVQHASRSAAAAADAGRRRGASRAGRHPRQRTAQKSGHSQTPATDQHRPPGHTGTDQHDNGHRHTDQHRPRTNTDQATDNTDQHRPQTNTDQHRPPHDHGPTQINTRGSAKKAGPIG